MPVRPGPALRGFHSGFSADRLKIESQTPGPRTKRSFSYICQTVTPKTLSKLIIHDFDDFARYTGQELGVSDYLQITQEQINLFADATLDHQWIHVDPERARTESPYKTTIAHGYLTLSLLPYLWGQVVEVENVKMLVNYGIEKLRFNQAVTVGSEVRLRATLLSLTNLRGIAKAEIKVSLEIRDCPKTAMDATVVFLYHFK